VTAAIPHMWQAGIVALHNANDDCDALSFRTYQALHKEDALRMRVLQHIPVCNLRHARGVGLQSGLGDRWLRVGGVKMFADGALGSRTASMLQPFTGEPDNWGVTAMDPEEMLEQALAASQAGFTLTIHAIGDRANRDVLDILGEVRRQENGRGLRHRIEHVQLIHDEDLPRLAQLDIIASVQPIHATSDMLIVDRYWGSDRAPNAYPFRRLLDFGTHLVFGSDGPIEPHAPLLGIHAATTRRREDGAPGPGGWQTQERIKVGEAVDAYTYWPAYAAGEESYRGSIAPGKVADLAVLSQDIFRGDPQEILKCQVEMTVLNGEIVWRQPE
jgi:predicted amidohydrolase YtcJ